MQKTKKTAILLLCCVLFITLFSLLISSTALIHECEIDECPFECAICKAEKSLSDAVYGADSITVTTVAVFFTVAVILAQTVNAVPTTPVKLKVKITD